MLEESRMDKKSTNRSSQTQSRASAIDCKKNTESTHKPWPRNNKKREGSSNNIKNEPHKKNVPAQRGRGQVDKRPRARVASNYFMGGTQNTGLEDDSEPEIGSVFASGSKKQNLNHLLNFMYPSRGGAEQSKGPSLRRQHHLLRRHDHDLYLRANCQFVLKEDGDFKTNLLDPDVPVKWDQIEEIVLRSTGKSECPICLGTPAAGRVGLCGHVYCWACVLHYAATHEKQPPPCPVCVTPLRVKEMKPTRIVQWETPTEEVTMRLVRRLRGSTTVEAAPTPGVMTDSSAAQVLPFEDINSAPYAKFFMANKIQVCEILNRERLEIKNQIMAEIDTTEIVYLEEALEILKLKEKDIEIQSDSKLTLAEKELNTNVTPTKYEEQSVAEVKYDWFNVSDDGPACIKDVSVVDSNLIPEAVVKSNLNPEPVFNSNLNPEAPDFFKCDISNSHVEEFPLIQDDTPENKTDSPTLTDIDKQNQAKYFYFYQGDDGQQVFLDRLNVRILNASWGALAAAPPLISGRVLHRETQSLVEQTRKRMPFTAHLPLYCSFDIVELELLPPYVTEAALQGFADDLERNAKARANYKREERRREQKYRRAMEGPPKPDFSSEVLFPPAAPTLSSSFDPPLDPYMSSYEEHSSHSSLPNNVSPPQASGLSFAKMASTSGTWRVRSKPTNIPEAPMAPSPDEEGSAPRTMSLSDAIEAALHAPPRSNGKKNKKNKSKVLFDTSMKRAA